MAIELKHVACWEWSVMNVTSTHVIWTIGILTDFQINSLSTAAKFYRLIIINFRQSPGDTATKRLAKGQSYAMRALN